MRTLGDTYCQVVFHANLAGQTVGLQQVRLSRQGGALLLAHWRRFAGDDLDAAGHAARVPAAAMEDVKARVFQAEDEFFPASASKVASPSMVI